MINAVLALWILVEALRRRFRRLIPVSVLVLLYEAADVGWLRASEYLTMEGTIKKLILMALVVFVFLAWRGRQAKLSAVITSLLALGSRMAWEPVRSGLLDALQQPEAEHVALLAQGAVLKAVLSGLTSAMLLAMLVMLLVSVRRMPLKSNC